MRVRHDGVTQIHGSCRAESIRRVSLIGDLGQLRFNSQQSDRTNFSTMGLVLDEAWRMARGTATLASVARPRCLHRLLSASVMGEVRHADLTATNPVSACWAPHGVHGSARPSLHSSQGLTGTRPRSATRMPSRHAQPTSAVNGSTPSDSTCGSIACHARQTSYMARSCFARDGCRPTALRRRFAWHASRQCRIDRSNACPVDRPEPRRDDEGWQ